MEGTENQPTVTTSTTKKTLRRSLETENEEHDSGCERSPTSLSPSAGQNKVTGVLRTYDRDFLLSCQFSPLALNPDPARLLWPEYDNSSQYGVFNEKVCYHKKDGQLPSSTKKEMTESSFYKHPKLASDSGVTEMLRPQRKSFVSGCQMRASSTSESSNEKSAEGAATSSGGKPTLHHQTSISGGRGERAGNGATTTGENGKERPRSVPTVDRTEGGGRRVGSGRLVIERTDNRPDSRGSGSGKEKAPRPPLLSADKTDNWRSRDPAPPPLTRSDAAADDDYVTESRGGFTNHHREQHGREPHGRDPHGREPHSRDPHSREPHGREHGRDSRDIRGDPRNNRRELHRGTSGYGERNQYNNHRGNHHHNHHHDDAEPEWFTEDVCMTDTIELKGFDGHKEKIERREKKEREKKERKAGEKKGGTTSAADKKDKSKAGSNAADRSEKTNTDHTTVDTTSASSDVISNHNRPHSKHTTSGGNKDLTAENMFDFDTFMDTIQLHELGLNDSSSGSVAEASSSKFSRWFKPEDDPHHHPHQSSAPRGGRYPGDGVFGVESTSSGLIPQSLQHFGTGMSDELHVDTHMTSLVQDLLSPLSNDLTPRGRATNDVIDSLLDSPPPVPSPSSSRSSHRSKEGGSRILNMLQNAAANSAASSATQHAQSKPEPKEQPSNQMPHALSKLFTASPAAANSAPQSRSDPKPSLPANFKTLEELEADLEPQHTEKLARDHHHHHNKHSHKHHHHPQQQQQHSKERDSTKANEAGSAAQPPQEMAAFNKLLGMLQVTGELKSEIPAMPEVTNTETPTQLKKHTNILPPNSAILSQAELEQVETGSPILPPSQASQHKPTSSSYTTNTQPQQQHVQHTSNLNNDSAILSQNASNLLQPLLANQIPVSVMRSTPPNLLTQGLMAGLMPTNPATAGLLPGHTGPGMMLPHSTAQPPPPVNIAAAMHASAFQGAAVNPLLHQTIHQRQKLPSPIMFGAQPPVHIAAPAPIHPIAAAMAATPLQQILGQQQRQQQGNPGSAQGQGGQMPLQFTGGHQGAPVSQMSSQHQMMEQMMSQQQPIQSLPPSKPATVASMAFTPTSVMRKMANDKVDRSINDNQQLKSIIDSIQQPSADQNRQQYNSNQPSMRPIVKNNGPSVAEQMMNRQFMMEQNAMRHAQHQQQHQQQMNQLFHQQQQHQHNQNIFQQQQQQANMIHQQSLDTQQHNQNQHNPGMGPSVSPLQLQLAFIQQAQQQQQRAAAAAVMRERLSPDNNITKWFCGAELGQQGGLPQVPKHAAILKLEDIEN